MATSKTDENRVRRKAARKGLSVQKLASSGSGGWFNRGGYRLIDPRWKLPLLGKRYDASLSRIERHLDHL